MHPALEVPEILCLIFKCGITERDLSDCARVCRLWGIWAVDVLWGTCRVPLQQVLQVLAPGPAFRIREEDYGGVLPIFNIENIDEHKWRRFLALSSRISRIRVDCGVTKASLESIEIAKQTFNGEPFSQLQAVTLKILKGHGDYYASSLAIVTVTSLTSMYFRAPHTSYHCPTVVWVNKNLPARAPNITHFRLRAWQDAKLPDLSRYSALKYIEVRVDYIRPHFWEALASCRLLTKVVLKECTTVAEEGGETWRVDYVQFPALRTFRVQGGEPRNISKLIIRSRMPMLECLFWDLGLRGGEHEAENLMAPHLKAYSPRLDVDYALYNLMDYDTYVLTDSDEECW